MNDAATGIPESVMKQGKIADDAIAKIAKGEAVTIVEGEGLIEESAAPVKKAEPAKKQEAPETSEDTWKAKYNSLKGKYDAEVPRLSEQVSELLETSRRQQATIDTLLKTVDQAGDGGDRAPREVINEPGKAATHSRGFSKVSREDFSGYGDEVLSLVDAVNAQGQIIQDLTGKLGTVENRVQTTTKNTFLGELGRISPNWQKLNTDKGFLRWLDEKETPRSRETRIQLFDHYVDQQDAPQVASFFNDYITETRWKPDDAGKRAIGGTSGMEEEIVPASDVAFDTSGEASKRLGFAIITRDQLAKATRDRVGGRITEEEFNKISDNYQRTYAAVRAGKLTL
jgi:hypothetical protein